VEGCCVWNGGGEVYKCTSLTTCESGSYTYFSMVTAATDEEGPGEEGC